MDEIEGFRRQLANLKTEHRDLDDVIDRLASDPTSDRLQIQRLKKRKLALKDEISAIENQLLPDIIA
jgi:hypothetical protein